MNDDARIERQLPQILADLGAGSSPDYTEIILARTAAARQRPGWVFPERWLPMSAITQRMAAAPHVSWRALVVLALLVLALVSAVLYAGSQQRHLPAPFGPAANGVIPYVSNGDLYVGDPITGESRLLVGGPEDDALPQFSPDGTRLAFKRDVGTTSIKPIDIYVVGADGSDPTQITPEPIWDSKSISWTPDGRASPSFRSSTPAPTSSTCTTPAATDPSRRSRQPAEWISSFRPPDGRRSCFGQSWTGSWACSRWTPMGRTRSRSPSPRSTKNGLFGPRRDLHRRWHQNLYQHGDAVGQHAVSCSRW